MMKKRRISSWYYAKKYFMTLSCVTALTAITFIAKPAVAESPPTETATSEEVLTVPEAAQVFPAADKGSVEDVDYTTAAPSEASAETATSESMPTTEKETSETTNESQVAEPSTSESTSTVTSESTSTSAQAAVSQASEQNGGHYHSDDKGNWYYTDANGINLTGAQTINGDRVYFDENGVQVKGAFASDGHYYDPDTGTMWTSRFVSTGDNHWYYVNDKGDKATGLQTIDSKTYHFDNNGLQTKGTRVLINGKGYYFHPDSGELWNNKLRKIYRNTYVNGTYDELWYYYDNDGNIYEGPLTLDGKEHYFTPGEVRWKIFKNPDGTESFYNEDGIKVYNDWGSIRYMYLRGYLWTPKIYLDENGHVVHGFKTIDGHLYYFDESGSLRDDVPGSPKPLFEVDGNQYFADFRGEYSDTRAAILTNRIFTYEGVTYSADETGKLTKVTNRKQYINVGNNWYYVDTDGSILKSEQTIDYVKVYFNQDGKQVKGAFADNGHYYDKDTGAMLTNRYIEVDGNWYYVDQNGNKLYGTQTIDGVQVYFDQNGIQAKGTFADDGHYYDKDTGSMLTKRYIEWDGSWYYLGAEGYALIGEAVIDGVNVYFHENGKQAKGELIIENGEIHYYDPHTGARVSNTTLTINGVTYSFDDKGNGRVI